MQLSWDAIQANSIAFSSRWKGFEGIEKQHDQQFIIELLACFGVDAGAVGTFQEKAGTKWVDYLWPGMLGIEMKSPGENLSAAKTQLFNYLPKLRSEAVPQYLIVSDFLNIHLYRLPTNDIHTFKTADLRKHIKKFADIAGYTTERARNDQVDVNVKAAEKMAKLHDSLKDHGYDGHELRIYLVRLLFCMFAEDTGIFPQNSLLDYIEKSKPDGSDLSERINKLFEILNMPPEIRAKRTLLSDEIKQFRYVNGSLFKDLLPSAEFNAKMRQTLIECMNFDWNKISPAIFGAMFQGVMDAKQRREMGAHYTSEANILKLINPLFMDGLWQEFDRVKTDPTALDRFHEKIARLNFLDPACGCGNFLIITYRELRILELEILKMKTGNNQMIFDITPMLKVGVEQFFGIEIEDFACQIAQVGMWLTDHQMNIRASEQFGTYYARLPLRHSATIVHGNALRLDWERVVPKGELSYILGNPPFVGYKNQSREQKEDMGFVCPNKNIDYVASWYFMAAKYIKNTSIRCAFVSTNSIVQGEQVAVMWKPLMQDGIYINFGIPTFKWSNEAKGKAAVHCVIVGFSAIITEPNINPYLLHGPTVFIEKRSKPICNVPEMCRGNEMVDNGNLLLNQEEYDYLISNEPQAKAFVKRFSMGVEFLHNIPRYCLWLVGASPNTLRSMPLVIQRVEEVRKYRSASNRKKTQELANTPTVFERTNNPQHYLVLPQVSSERRKYIPMGFLDGNTIVGSKLLYIEGCSLYHFGVLTSNVHNAWMRAVCGRMKSDYQYSASVVYNNFPWPDYKDEQKTAIEKLAQDVLNARGLFPESSLADLYDPLTMPPELLKAHQNLDRAVMKLYGFPVGKTTEADCVAALMERYNELTRVNE